MTQIGEVAEAVGLSLRTNRHYDDSGLVTPSGRTAGRFRPYTDVDKDRLRLTKYIKPLEFTLEKMRLLLDVLNRLDDASNCEDLGERLAQLATFAATVHERCEVPRKHLQADDRTVRILQRQTARHRLLAANPQ